MRARRLEFWFEYASTYSHLAAFRVEQLTRAAGFEVDWKPFLLGPIFSAQGWNDSPFNIYPAKGRYMWRDMQRLAAKYEIEFHRPSAFPRNGLLAARVTIAGAHERWLPDFVRAVYHANFAQDRDISKRETIEEILRALGADPAAILALALSDENKAKLREQSERAATRGIFGAPAFFAGDEMFWGSDRLEDAIAWLKRAAL
ncbi:MAG: 2-hydroxychromene-2-carboxylate isomerase [Candidatus Binataceae bacterium]|jgi:2-hydroxychromene-2-carboxylate isomerase